MAVMELVDVLGEDVVAVTAASKRDKELFVIPSP
jgi:hypothetical protein